MIMERLHAGWYALLASLRASVIALRHHPCRHDVYVERPHSRGEVVLKRARLKPPRSLRHCIDSRPVGYDHGAPPCRLVHIV